MRDVISPLIGRLLGQTLKAPPVNFGKETHNSYLLRHNPFYMKWNKLLKFFLNTARQNVDGDKIVTFDAY